MKIIQITKSLFDFLLYATLPYATYGTAVLYENDPNLKSVSSVLWGGVTTQKTSAWMFTAVEAKILARFKPVEDQQLGEVTVEEQSF